MRETKRESSSRKEGGEKRRRESMTLRGKIYQVLNLIGIKYSKGAGLRETNTSKYIKQRQRAKDVRV